MLPFLLHFSQNVVPKANISNVKKRSDLPVVPKEKTHQKARNNGTDILLTNTGLNAHASSAKNNVNLPPAPKEKTRQKTCDAEPRSIPEEMLDRARNGPVDNKRVLEAMFQSGNRKKNKRPISTESKSSPGVLLGLLVGGDLLHRSASLDESEVTGMGCGEDLSNASMTTIADRVEEATNRIHLCGNVSSPQRDSIANTVSNVFRSRATSSSAPNSTKISSHPQLLHTNPVGSHSAIGQTQTHHVPNSSVQLPSGWKVRWSRTKQKPYYVHPDFGSTWHCPGLVGPSQTIVQSDILYDNQRLEHRGDFLQYSQMTNASQMAESSRGNFDAHPKYQSGAENLTGGNSHPTARVLANEFSGMSSMRETIDTRHNEHPSQGPADGFKSGELASSNKMTQSAQTTKIGESASRDLEGSSKSVTAKHNFRTEVMQNLDRVRDSHEKDALSAKHSSKHLSSDVESTTGVASVCDHLKEGTSPDKDVDQCKKLVENADMELHSDDTPVQFDNGQASEFDESEEELQEVPSNEEIEQPHENDEVRFDQARTANRASVSGRVTKEQDDINSLMSNGVGLDTLLRNGSPLPPIQEFCAGSSKCQSSQDSLNEMSINSTLHVGPNSQNHSRNGYHSFQTLSHHGDGSESTIDRDSGNELNSGIGTIGGELGSEHDDYESNGNNESPLFENDGGANNGFDDGSDSSGSSSNAVLNLDKEFKKEKKQRQDQGCKKKRFPPGPFCSLQFLDEIAGKEFDTPLWRNMKRKRSTLPSVKRSKANQKKI